MTDDNLPPFLFDGEIIVRVLIIDSSPWFVAADVCRALGLTNPTEVVRGLKEDEKRLTSIDTKRGLRDVIVISESGLYVLIFKSREDVAVRFRKWVTGEVLPSVRQTGGYISPSAIIVRKPCAEWSFEEWRVKISIINMAHRTFTKATAAWIWEHEGLPMPPPNLLPAWWQSDLIG
jgi:prophage antirepressor-like protein